MCIMKEMHGGVKDYEDNIEKADLIVQGAKSSAARALITRDSRGPHVVMTWCIHA